MRLFLCLIKTFWLGARGSFFVCRLTNAADIGFPVAGWPWELSTTQRKGARNGKRESEGKREKKQKRGKEGKEKTIPGFFRNPF
jgi:hypothetical protein